MTRGRRAMARVARYQYFRHKLGTTHVTLIATITDGPATEIGRDIHVAITTEELQRAAKRTEHPRVPFENVPADHPTVPPDETLGV